MVKEGSKWTGGDKTFVVISSAVIDGNEWVYYRSVENEPKEFSCFEASFLEQFVPLPD